MKSFDPIAEVDKLNVLLKMFDLDAHCSICSPRFKSENSELFIYEPFYVLYCTVPKYHTYFSSDGLSFSTKSGFQQELREYGTFEELERHVKSLLNRE